MVLKFDASEFFEGFGENTQDFTASLRDAIVGHACDIWERYPKWMSEGSNPVSSFQRGFMNSACSKKPGFSPPQIEPPSFEGGQCPVQYEVLMEATTSFNGQPQSNRTSRRLVYGPIENVEVTRPIPNNDPRIIGFYVLGRDINGNVNEQTDPIGGVGWEAQLISVEINRLDGLPDDCGGSPPGYPDIPPPTSNELNVDITVNSFDGNELTFPVTWYSIRPDFNFPITLDVGGIDVTLDLSGLTLKGDPTINNPRGNNEPLVDTDKDVTLPDGSKVTIFQPTSPPILPVEVLETIEDIDLQWVVCESGILQTVNEIVKVSSGAAPWLKVLFPILINMIEELCAEESDVGVPEIYPVLPGAERPVIMYYYKEDLGEGKKGVSTYTSSLPNPTTDAINEVGDGKFPNRALGKFVCTIRLTDGSRLIGRGITETDGRAHLNFLLARTNPAFIPSDAQECIVVTKNEKFEEIRVKCSQVEYYPDGKAFGVNPSVLQIIKFE